MQLVKSKIIKVPLVFAWRIISDVPLMGELTPDCLKAETVSLHKKGLGAKHRWYSKDHPGEFSLEEITYWSPLEGLSWRAFQEGIPFMEGSLTLAPTLEGYTILIFSEDFFSEDVDLLKNEEEMEKELESLRRYMEAHVSERS